MELKEILEYINIIHNPYMLKSCIMDVLRDRQRIELIFHRYRSVPLRMRRFVRRPRAPLRSSM